MQKVFVQKEVTGTHLSSRLTFSKHTHDEFGIGVIESGAQRSLSGRGPVEAGSGDVITVNPGEVHDGVPIGGKPRQWRMLYFGQPTMARFGHGISGMRDRGIEFCAPHFPASPAGPLFLALYEYLRKGGEIANLFAEQSALQLLANTCEIVGRKARHGHSLPVIDLAMEYIDDCPARRITLDDLSALCGISKFQMIRAFRRQTAMTPHSYIVQSRLRLAKCKLSAGKSVVEAALESGFSDQSHLTRCFAATFGYTPGKLSKAAAFRYPAS